MKQAVKRVGRTGIIHPNDFVTLNLHHTIKSSSSQAAIPLERNLATIFSIPILTLMPDHPWQELNHCLQPHLEEKKGGPEKIEKEKKKGIKQGVIEFWVIQT